MLKPSQAAHLRAEAASLTCLGLYKAQFAGGIVKCLESSPYTSLLAETVSPGDATEPPVSLFLRFSVTRSFHTESCGTKSHGNGVNESLYPIPRESGKTQANIKPNAAP